MRELLRWLKCVLDESTHARSGKFRHVHTSPLHVKDSMDSILASIAWQSVCLSKDNGVKPFALRKPPYYYVVVMCTVPYLIKVL